MLRCAKHEHGDKDCNGEFTSATCWKILDYGIIMISLWDIYGELCWDIGNIGQQSSIMINYWGFLKWGALDHASYWSFFMGKKTGLGFDDLSKWWNDVIQVLGAQNHSFVHFLILHLWSWQDSFICNLPMGISSVSHWWSVPDWGYLQTDVLPEAPLAENCGDWAVHLIVRSIRINWSSCFTSFHPSVCAHHWDIWSI